jgi:hypothetical protein
MNMKKLMAAILAVAAMVSTTTAFGEDNSYQEAYRLYGASGFSDGSEYQTMTPVNDYSDWPMAL